MWKWLIVISIIGALLVVGYACRPQLQQLYISYTSEPPRQANKPALNQESALEHAEKHLDPSYVCPMHGQIIKNEPGSCPICGMDLVQQEPEPVSEDTSEERKILYWVAPMDANYKRDKPGKSPLGMDLVPVYAQSDTAAGSVKIDPAVQQNIGVRLTKVTRGDFRREIKTVGYVKYDEDTIAHIHLRTEGWIEKLAVKAVGDRVKKGQLLMELYSPELIRAQQDFIRVLSQDSKALAGAAERNLIALGMSRRQLEQLKKHRQVSQTVKIYSPQNGFIERMGIREGMFANPAVELMSLVDLTSVWIQTSVYERQARWINEGQDMRASLNAYPRQQWQGKVDYVYPELDPVTRTLQIRLRVPNPQRLLKKEMYAEVTINAGLIENVLMIPKMSVIRDGENERVIVALGNGNFQQRMIKSGDEMGDQLIVLEGLSEAEEVVISSQFLIDSEASLKASFLRMQPFAVSASEDIIQSGHSND